MKNLEIVKLALREDIGSGDITTKLIISAKQKIKARIIAKEKGIVCGLAVARLVFKTVDKNIHFKPATSDGKQVKKGQVLARLQGKAVSILGGERVALNFLSHLSGVATLTNRYVQKVRPYKVKIMDTRKTTPGLRSLEKYAVRCGGGVNHRLNLSDQVLIKDNHLSSLKFKVKSLKLKDIIDKIRKNAQGRKIEIEVKNIREFREVLKARPDIIMLDNFSVANIKKAVKIKSASVKLEVSGGVNLSNVRRIAATGVERISIGELTHSAGALDIALDCE